MADADTGDRVHHQTGVAGKCPSRPIGCAYDVRQVARAPWWADLNRGAGPFTQAPGLVEGGHDMSCGIVPNLVELRNPPSDIGESEPVVCRPGADRISRRRIDLATLDRQTVPVRVEPLRVEGEGGCGNAAMLDRADKLCKAPVAGGRWD